MKLARESGIWLIVLLTILALGGLISLSYRSYQLAYAELNAQLNQRLILAVNTAVDDVTPMLETAHASEWPAADRARLQELLQSIRLSFQLENLFVFDRDRRSVADARPNAPVGKAYNYLQIPTEAIEQIWMGETFIDYRRDTESLSFRNAAQPLLVRGDIAGGVYAQASLDFDQSLIELRSDWWVSVGLSLGLSVLFLVALLAIQLRVRNLQEAMNRRSRMELIHQLSAGIAHDIKNPLAAILGGAELIEMRVKDDEALENLGLIKRGALAINEITETLLGSGRSTSPVTFPLAPFVRDTMKPFSPRAMARKVIMDSVIADDLEVYVAKTSLRMALSNLISNAIEAMGESDGGKIHLSIRPGKDQLGLAVSDNGPGISPRQQRKIFDPLHTTKDTGSGLGLPVARQLMEDQGGKLELESEPGVGSTFIIWLPIKADG